MGPMFMILTALHEEVPSNASNEEHGRDAPDLHAETQSEVRNRGERENHGAVAERTSEASPEHILDDNHIGEDANETGNSGRSRGE